MKIVFTNLEVLHVTTATYAIRFFVV